MSDKKEPPGKPEKPTETSSARWIAIFLAFMVCVGIWHKMQEWYWWVSPSDTPALSRSGIIDHTGYVLWAGNKDWQTILTKDNRVLKCTIDIPGNPSRAEFDEAWSQIIARLVYKDGSRSSALPIREILNREEQAPAIEIKAEKGKHKRLWLIVDHIPKKFQ